MRVGKAEGKVKVRVRVIAWNVTWGIWRVRGFRVGDVRALGD